MRSEQVKTGPAAPVERWRPKDVIEIQVELIRWLRFSKYAPNYLNGFLSDMGKSRDSGQSDEDYVKVVADVLDRSDSYFVEEDVVVRLWELALKDDAPVRFPPREELPSWGAFTWLECPLILPDARGDHFTVHGFQWAAGEAAVKLVVYSHRDHPLDVNNAIVRERAKDMGVSHTTLEPRAVLFHIQDVEYGFELSPAKISGAPDRTYPDVEAFNYAKVMMVALHRFFTFLWVYMGSELPTRQALSPKAQKRLAKARTRIPAEIRVVGMPRSHDGERTGEHRDIEWSHRWRVRPHLRKIKTPDGTVRIVPVRGHIKGPDFLPIIEKDVVHRVHS